MLSVHLNTVGVTVVRTIPGMLHALVINQRGSANSRVILRDGLRVIADVDTGGPSVVVGSIDYHVPFNVNLTVERVGTAPPAITVTFG